MFAHLAKDFVPELAVIEVHPFAVTNSFDILTGKCAPHLDIVTSVVLAPCDDLDLLLLELVRAFQIPVVFALPDPETMRRAEREGFEFTLLGNGDVEVVNTSHEVPEKNIYTVHVKVGTPADCTCPTWGYQDGACKYIVAIAIREHLIKPVNAEPTVRADGGVRVEAAGFDHFDERPDNRDCSKWNQALDLSCGRVTGTVLRNRVPALKQKISNSARSY